MHICKFFCTFAAKYVSMTYEQTLEYLYNSQPAFHLVGAAAYKPGLHNTELLMAHLGNPHEQFRSVHVAGTNGKGSTSHLIAASLQAAGLKVGLYTSPHLVDFRERIRINGQMIPEQRVVDFVEEHHSSLEELKPSFFETTMGLAFSYFAEEHVDVAVVEVGLGGRLDSTNIITPLLSVITNIGLDHTEFLGTTLSAIASEKAGIIKPSVPCVIGETHPETSPVFEQKARECGIWGDGLETTNCRIWFADQCGYLRKVREQEVTTCQLTGAYQEKNQQTAYVALRVLSDIFPTLTHAAIAEGFANVVTLTGLRGRWEMLSEYPRIICDTGHNSHGIRTYVQQLRNLSRGDSHLRIIFGMVNDKDVDTVLSLLPTEAYYYWVEASTHRAIPAEEMKRLGLNHALIGEAFGPVEVALNAARKEAKDDDLIFIGGSNYVVGEALRLLS